MSELICTKCGAPLQNNAKYCTKCGTRVGLAVKIEVSEKTLAKRAKDEAKIAEQKAKKQERDAKREAKREENKIKRQTPAYKKMQKIVGTTVPCSVIVVTLLLVFLLVPIQANAMGYDICLDPSDSGGVEIYDYNNNRITHPKTPEEIWYLGAMRPVTSIGNYAFSDCDSLTSIVIPDSVTKIGSAAFERCDSLSNIVIPDSVTTIGSWAFYGCDSLTSIVIPDSVTTIGYHAFYGCDSLTSIVIPDSVTTIDNGAFYGCNSLTDVYFTGTEEQWNSIVINGFNSNLKNATIHYNYVPEQN